MTLLDAAREVYAAHDCQACHNGGSTAILQHRQEIADKACKQVGLGTAFTKEVSRVRKGGENGDE